MGFSLKKEKRIIFLCFADGLVSYNVPVGEQMNLPAYPVYLNDSVYDGAIIYRCVTVYVLGFFFVIFLHHTQPSHFTSTFLQSSPLPCCCPVSMVTAETDSGEWAMVVYC